MLLKDAINNLLHPYYYKCELSHIIRLKCYSVGPGLSMRQRRKSPETQHCLWPFQGLIFLFLLNSCGVQTEFSDNNYLSGSVLFGCEVGIERWKCFFSQGMNQKGTNFSAECFPL